MEFCRCPAIFLSIIVLVVGNHAHSHAQVFDERFDDWPLETTLRGSIVVAGKLSDLSVVPEKVRKAIGRRVEIVGSVAQQDLEAVGLTTGKRLDPDNVDQNVGLHPLVIPSHLLWSDSPQAARTKKLADLQIEKGGVVILVGEWKVTDAAPSDRYPLPNCRIETGFEFQRDRQTLIDQLRDLPRTVGIGLPSESVLILSGRKIMCFGRQSHFFVASKRYDTTIETHLQQRTDGDDIHSWLIDLTQLRRQAIDQELEPFPPLQPRTPNVPRGTLMIVGGGGMPKGLMQDFVDVAGGKKAKLVYVPCSEADDVPDRPSMVRQWQSMGVKSAEVLHTKDRSRANNDQEFFESLKEATGIWYGGGRQWNFADSYYGTTTHRLMKEVLKRGGVIGGSSAGASIQARYLARATPIQNFDIMAPGYERGGLGFVSGVAIDQHFSQRRRHRDMKELVAKYPQLLGIGIDEATAIVVRGSMATVRGEGSVFFFDRLNMVALSAGQTYDLAGRQEVRESEKASAK